MKNLNKIIWLIIAAFTLASCSSDDEDYPKKNITKAHTYSTTIEAIKDQEQQKEIVLKLSDMLPDNIAYNIVLAEFQRGKSSFKIDGLANVDPLAKLQNFTIRIGNRNKINLGTCTPDPSSLNEFSSDRELDDDKYTDIIRLIFEDLVKNKEAKIYLSFTSTHTMIETTHPVYFQISINGYFLYNIRE